MAYLSVRIAHAGQMRVFSGRYFYAHSSGTGMYARERRWYPDMIVTKPTGWFPHIRGKPIRGRPKAAQRLPFIPADTHMEQDNMV